MNIIFRSDSWLDTQAKTLERKILKAHGTGPSFSTIGRYLLRGVDGDVNALLEIRDGDTLVIDEDEYKSNKLQVIAKFLKADKN